MQFSKSLHQLNNEEVNNFRLQLTSAVSNSSFQINTKQKGCPILIFKAVSFLNVGINCYTGPFPVLNCRVQYKV